MNHYTFVMVGYNSQPWIDTCVQSVLRQNYENFDVIAIDALTNDGTYDCLKKYEELHNFKLFRNETRKYQTENIKFGVGQAKEDSIIITVDFDDWLPHQNVLDILNEYYDENTWLTYGTYSEYHGQNRYVPARTDVYHRYPDEVISRNNFREYRWMASHLRTFRKKLFDKIENVDFIDKTRNDYYNMAGDMSFMFPMIEMCGERFKYIDREMYVYNRTNILSEDRVNLQEQERQADAIKTSRRYERIEIL